MFYNQLVKNILEQNRNRYLVKFNGRDYETVATTSMGAITQVLARLAKKEFVPEKVPLFIYQNKHRAKATII